MKYMIALNNKFNNYLKKSYEKIIKKPYLFILIFLLLFTLIRFIISLLIEEPTMMGDELAYKSMAYNFYKYKNFYKYDYANLSNLPNYIYQFIISVSFFFNDNFYNIIKLINSILMNLSIIPIYLISRKFNDEKNSVLISILILLIPSYSYINFVMPEVLYYTMFLFYFYFILEYFYNLKLKYSVLAGISLILLFFIKPHALLLFFVVFIMLLINLFINYKNKENLKKIFLTVPFFLLSIIIGYIILKFLTHKNINNIFGFYDSHIKNIFTFGNFPIKDFLILILNHFSTFLFIYLLPCIISLIALIKFIKEKKYKETIFLSMIFLTMIFLFLMVLKFSLDNYHIDIFPSSRINSRFYFMAYPLFIVSFISFHKNFTLKTYQKIIILFIFGIISFYYIIFTKYTGKYPWCYVGENLDLSWTFIFQLKYIIIIFVIYVLVLLSYFFSNKTGFKLLITFFICLFLILNYGQIYFLYNYHNKQKLTFRPLRYFIQINILSKDSNILLIDSNFDTRMNVCFWLNYNYKSILEIPPKTVLNKNIIPEEVDFIVLLDEYKVEFDYNSNFNFGKYNIFKLKN